MKTLNTFLNDYQLVATYSNIVLMSHYYKSKAKIDLTLLYGTTESEARDTSLLPKRSCECYEAMLGC